MARLTDEEHAAWNRLRVLNEISDSERQLLSHIESLEAEIAALRELMACGHPGACETFDGLIRDGNGNVHRCTACEDKRLAVATALGEAGKLTHGDSGMGVVMDAGYNAGWNAYGAAVRALKGGSR